MLKAYVEHAFLCLNATCTFTTHRWHAAGRQLAKANSVLDLLACAHFLVEQRYTTPGRIGGHATSAGASTLAAAVNAEPELFGAVVLQVGMADSWSMLTESTGSRHRGGGGAIL